MRKQYVIFYTILGKRYKSIHTNLRSWKAELNKLKRNKQTSNVKFFENYDRV